MASHVSVVSKVAVCLVLWLPGVLSLPHLNKREVHTVEVELVESEDIAKRSPDSGIPDSLQFKFPLEGKDVHLRLKRSKLIPAITTSGKEANDEIQERGVYVDMEGGTSVMVKRTAGQYALSGTVAHQGQLYNMEPAKTAKRGKFQDHIIIPNQEEDYNMKKDEPPTPANRGKELILKKKKNLKNKLNQLKETVSVAEREPFKDHIVIPNQEEDYNLEKDVPLTPANRGKELILKKKKHLKNKLNQLKELLINKRQQTQHVVEISFIIDNTVYKAFEAYYGSAGVEDEIRTWYTYIANLIDIRYNTIEAIKINTKVVKLLIFDQDTEENRFVTNLADSYGLFDGVEGLKKLSQFVEADGETRLPASDHFMYFTRLDIDEATGIAYVGQVCFATGVSIIEETFSGGVGPVAAHELGHSLGSKHDMQTGCDDGKQNIMSTVLQTPLHDGNEGNNHHFSSCSISQITDYLDSLASWDCTLPEYTEDVNVLPPPPEGQFLSRDEQCRLHNQDPSSRYCGEIVNYGYPEEGMCKGIWCIMGDGCRPILPQEYTPCGTDKWCVMGNCVDKVKEEIETKEPEKKEPEKEEKEKGNCKK